MIIDHTVGLEKQAYIGQKEELLSERLLGFRYLVLKSYKIIYWINEPKNRIDIAHVFDIRQDPFKIRETEQASKNGAGRKSLLPTMLQQIGR